MEVFNIPYLKLVYLHELVVVERKAPWGVFDNHIYLVDRYTIDV